MENICRSFVVITLYFVNVWTSLGVGPCIRKMFGIMVGLGLSFKNLGLDLDCNI